MTDLPAGVTPRDVFNAMEALYMATPRNKPFRQLSVTQRAKLETEARAVFGSLAGRVVVPREATDEMCEAAMALDRVEHGVLVTPVPSQTWNAMIDAAVDGGA
jgi:hypothetical protein